MQALEGGAADTTERDKGRSRTQAGPTEDVPIDVLGARICGLACRLAQATFHWLVMIAEFDRREGWSGVGIKSCAHWLAWTCSMAPGTAREHVRVARALVDLPLVSAEMAAGRLSYAKVREITRVSDRVDEAALVELARTATASQLARSIRGFRRCDTDRLIQEDRRTATWWTDDDGSVAFSFRLPAEEGALVIAALEAARDDIRRTGETSPRTEKAGRRSEEVNRQRTDRGVRQSRQDARRPRNESRSDQPEKDPPATNDTADTAPPIAPADMVLQWARGYLAATPKDRSGEDRTTVVVHVAADRLAPTGSHTNAAGHTNADSQARSRGNAARIRSELCEVAHAGGISPGTALRLACNGRLIGIVRGSNGAVLEHGRQRRTVSAAQRRLLGIRDQHCQFPSCERTTHLEAHHVQHWAHGGRTDLDNLLLLCRFHHMTCHEGSIAISAAPASEPGLERWTFTNKDGQLITADMLQDISPWSKDEWLLWHGLDGSAGWRDPEASRIRPLWAGERFNLADTVSVLFGAAA